VEQVKKIWEMFVNFLVTYDSHKISDLMSNLNWERVIRNPYVWLIGLSSLGYLVYKKAYKSIILIASVGVFLYLVQVTLPPSGQSIPLDKLLTFIGGCLFLGVLNLYFLFMRGD
jgi:hypothetical protein